MSAYGLSLGKLNMHLSTDTSRLSTGFMTFRDQMRKTKTQARGLGSGLQNLKQSFISLNDAAMQLGRTLSLRLSVPLAIIGTMALKTAGEFQLAMNRVRAISEATGNEFGHLIKQAKDLGKSTQFSARQVAGAMQYLAMTGLNAVQIIGSVPSVLNLAASALIDMATAADIVTNIMAGFAISVDKLPNAVDALVKAFTSANTNLVQLGHAMKYVGPIAHSMGFDFYETVAAVSLLGNAGIQATLAGTSLRGAMLRITRPTGEAADALAALGINIKEPSGRLKGLIEIIEEFEVKIAQAGGTAKAAGDVMMILGLRAGPGWLALLSQGSEKLKALTKSLKDSSGYAEKVAKIQMEGYAGALKRIISTSEGVGIAFGEVMIPTFEKVSNKIVDFNNYLINMGPASRSIIVTVATAAAAFGPLILILALLPKLFTPFTILASLAIIFGAAAAFVWSNWEKLGPQFHELLDAIRKDFRSFIDETFTSENFKIAIDESSFGQLTLAIAAIGGSLWSVYKIVKWVFKPLLSVLPVVKKIRFGMLGWVVIILAIGESVLDLYRNWDTVSKEVSEVYQKIKDIGKQSIDIIINASTDFYSTVKNKLVSLKEFVSQFPDLVVKVSTSGNTEAFPETSFIGGVLDFFAGIPLAIEKLEIPQKIADIFSFENMKAALSGVKSVVDFFSDIFSGIKIDFTFLTKIQELISDIIDALIKAAKELQDVFSIKNVHTAFQGFIDGLKEVKDMIVENILGPFTDVKNTLSWIKDTGQSFLNYFTGDTQIPSPLSAQRQLAPSRDSRLWPQNDPQSQFTPTNIPDIQQSLYKRTVEAIEKKLLQLQIPEQIPSPLSVPRQPAPSRDYRIWPQNEPQSRFTPTNIPDIQQTPYKRTLKEIEEKLLQLQIPEHLEKLNESTNNTLSTLEEKIQQANTINQKINTNIKGHQQEIDAYIKWFKNNNFQGVISDHHRSLEETLDLQRRGYKAELNSAHRFGGAVDIDLYNPGMDLKQSLETAKLMKQFANEKGLYSKIGKRKDKQGNIEDVYIHVGTTYKGSESRKEYNTLVQDFRHVVKQIIELAKTAGLSLSEELKNSIAQINKDLKRQENIFDPYGTIIPPKPEAHASLKGNVNVIPVTYAPTNSKKLGEEVAHWINDADYQPGGQKFGGAVNDVLETNKKNINEPVLDTLKDALKLVTKEGSHSQQIGISFIDTLGKIAGQGLEEHLGPLVEYQKMFKQVIEDFKNPHNLSKLVQGYSNKMQQIEAERAIAPKLHIRGRKDVSLYEKELQALTELLTGLQRNLNNFDGVIENAIMNYESMRRAALEQGIPSVAVDKLFPDLPVSSEQFREHGASREQLGDMSEIIESIKKSSIVSEKFLMSLGASTKTLDSFREALIQQVFALAERKRGTQEFQKTANLRFAEEGINSAIKLTQTLEDNVTRYKIMEKMNHKFRLVGEKTYTSVADKARAYQQTLTELAVLQEEGRLKIVEGMSDDEKQQVQDMLDKIPILTEEFQKLKYQLNMDKIFLAIETSFNQTINQMVTGLARGTQTMSEAFNNLGRNIAASLSSYLIQYAFEQILNYIKQLIIQTTIFKSLMSFFGLGGGGDVSVGTDTVGGFNLPGLKPSPFRHGGHASRNTPYIVGDGGEPELFVPDTSGRVIPQRFFPAPNVYGSGGSDVVVNVHNYTNDEVSVQQRSNSQGQIQQLEIFVKNTVTKDIYGGGEIAQGITNVFGARRSGVRR